MLMQKFLKVLSQSFTSTDMNDIIRAYEFAKEKHKGQVRIGGGDYINHPERVAIAAFYYAKLNEPAPVKALVIVSLLHDTVEDTDASFADVSNLFGEEIAKAVKALSHEDEEETDEVYLARVKEGGKIAILTKRFDKLDNIKSLVGTSKEFKESKIKENKQALPIWELMDPEGAEQIKHALEEVQNGNSSPKSGS